MTAALSEVQMPRAIASDDVLRLFESSTRRSFLLAFEVGMRTGRKNPVSVGSLLTSLIYIDPELRLLAEAASPPLNFERIFKELGTDLAFVEECLHALEGRGVGPEPSAIPREQLTPSVLRIVDYALDCAGQVRRENTILSAQDLVMALMHGASKEDRKQLNHWGLNPKVVEAILEVLNNRLTSSQVVVAPALRDVLVVPGFDRAASVILLLGRVLSRLRLANIDPPNTASTLLVAMAEADLVIGRLPEVSALRSNLNVDDVASAYSRYRIQAYPGLREVETMIIEETSRVPPTESVGLKSIREEAKAIATLINGLDAAAEPRHLATALILTRTGEINEASDWLISRRGLEPDSWRQRLGAIVATDYSGDNQQAWSRVLSGTRLIPTIQADTIPEDPREHDALGLRGYSDAIAALIASEALRPPLSIAVFGAWGSGKSFFMHMIRSAIEDFSGQDSRSWAGGPPSFMDSIVHIDFNAWHYAEENLWASLVQAILVGVQTQLSPETAPPIFQQILENLVDREQTQVQAKEKLAIAEASLRQHRDRLRDAEMAATEHRKAHAMLVTEDVMIPLRQLTLATLGPRGPRADPRTWIERVSQSVVCATEVVGCPDLAGDVPELLRVADKTADAEAALAAQIGDVQSVLSEVRERKQRGFSLLSWLARQRMEPEARRRLIVRIGLLLCLMLVLAAILFKLAGSLIGVISFLTSLIIPTIVLVRSTFRWIRSRLGDADSAFNVIEDLCNRIDRQREARSAERDVRLIEMEQKAIEAEAAVVKERLAYEESKAEVGEAREAIRVAGGTEQIRRFVGQRLDDGDYLRRLGLIHTISVDLNRLQGLLHQIQQEVRGNRNVSPTIRRIVLYIDDLDRCPPKRVVEVLEAVHLLLAFELFVVIVGVDIRWIGQALKKRYPTQLAGTIGIASPMDYLEKVFQIPFWLPPMDTLGAEKLLTAAIGPTAPAIPAAKVSATKLEVRSRGADVQAPSQGLHASPSLRRGASFGGERKSDLCAHATSEALWITAAELKQIRDLAAAVGISPRRAKRFANLYRVLKASLSLQERAAFVLQDGLGGGYRAALILLAFTTGVPSAAAAFLKGLKEMNASKASIRELLEGIQPSPDEVAAFAAAVAAINSELNEAATASEKIAIFQFWAPRVHRFAFDIGVI